MASGTIINPKPQILVERVTIISGGTSSTYYATFSANVEKNGYTPIAVGCPSFNQAGIFAYNTFYDGVRVDVGCAKISQSGSMSSLNVYIDVTYLKD